MTGASRAPAGIEGAAAVAAARRRGVWQEAGGVLALLTALALWGVVIAGVMAPLGDALARLDARRAEAQPACAAPAGALAAATPGREGACP